MFHMYMFESTGQSYQLFDEVSQQTHSSENIIHNEKKLYRKKGIRERYIIFENMMIVCIYSWNYRQENIYIRTCSETMWEQKI